MEQMISIVIPVYNERPNIKPLLENTVSVMRNGRFNFEIIIVDDGSTDGTEELLRDIKREYPELKVLFLRRNFGQSAALTAGFRYAKGDVIITMDGDLQNDPSDIPLLLKKLDEGYDMVSGWRKNRKDPFFSRKLPSIVANWLIGRLTGVRVHDYGCTLKAFRKEVCKNLTLYGELHRFIPVLISLYGAKIGEVVVKHNERRGGESKYGLNRSYRVILDLILMLFFKRFATRPLQFFGLNGGILFLIGFIIELYLTWIKLWHGEDIGGRPLLLLGVLLIITGIILFGIGLLAELIIRTYYEASDQDIFIVREILD